MIEIFKFDQIGEMVTDSNESRFLPGSVADFSLMLALNEGDDGPPIPATRTLRIARTFIHRVNQALAEFLGIKDPRVRKLALVCALITLVLVGWPKP